MKLTSKVSRSLIGILVLVPVLTGERGASGDARFNIGATQLEPTVILPYDSPGYRYGMKGQKDLPDPGFEKPGFDDSAFTTGSAAFESEGSKCPLQAAVRTPLPVVTQPLVRRVVSIGGRSSETGSIVPRHDQDEDGVPDETDVCPNSLVAPTVVIAGEDSGVRNVALGNGCTLADRIVACSLECPQRSGSNQRRFVSCVRSLANELVGDEVLTSEERSALISFVAAQERLCHRTRDRTVALPLAGITGTGCSKEEAAAKAQDNAGANLCVGANDPRCEGRCLGKDERCIARTKLPALGGCVFTQAADATCPGGIRFTCSLGQRPAPPPARVDCICQCRP